LNFAALIRFKFINQNLNVRPTDQLKNIDHPVFRIYNQVILHSGGFTNFFFNNAVDVGGGFKLTASYKKQRSHKKDKSKKSFFYY
jgi:hypothetical protein